MFLHVLETIQAQETNDTQSETNNQIQETEENKSQEDDEIKGIDQHHEPENQVFPCSNTGCNSEIFAACELCLCLLCFDHFEQSDLCFNHNPFAGVIFNDIQFSTPALNDKTIDNNFPSNGHVSEEIVFTENIPGNIPDQSLTENNGDAYGSNSTGEDKTMDNNVPSNDHVSEEIVFTENIPDIPNIPDRSLTENNIDRPENYAVDGEAMENTPTQSEKRNQRVQNKENRNHGDAYRSNSTGEERPARKGLKSRCNHVNHDRFECEFITDDHRQDIQDAFFNIGDLTRQREWVARHIAVSKPKISHGERKERSISYFLPKSEIKVRVCKVMFLNTIGVSERVVRTTIEKLEENSGVLEGEKRGGRRQTMKDAYLREQIQQHIERYPKMESHYCRQSTSYQYLSSDLNVAAMHRMFQNEFPDINVSETLYRNVFKGMKLKFHSPKKDMCGICESYRTGNPTLRAELSEKYTRHILQKEQVRRLKDEAKEKSGLDAKYVTASFDLQQVLYLPKSNRSEVFYKRRLACYNLTIFDIGSREGFCYFAHEGLTCRGSNEICSYVYDFLQKKDADGAENVTLFSDGCTGQNKNTITPTMLLFFIQNSVNVKTVSLHYFETGHGQNEGDSMHSAIEKEVSNLPEIFLPCQLAIAFQTARKKPKRPYNVAEVGSDDIQDWKELSVDLFGHGALRTRETDDGEPISWKAFMAVMVKKETPTKIFVKMSHYDDFQSVTLGRGRRRSNAGEVEKLQKPKAAYARGKPYPRLSAKKFEDLMKLVDSSVISHPDHVMFYRNLSHS